jgi:hypothetical protein
LRSNKRESKIAVVLDIQERRERKRIEREREWKEKENKEKEEENRIMMKEGLGMWGLIKKEE